MSTGDHTQEPMPQGPEDSEWLAGEFVLGVLEGEALERARALLRDNPAFAGEVAFWENCLGHMFEDVPEAPAPPVQWPQLIAARDALAAPAPAPSSSAQADEAGDMADPGPDEPMPGIGERALARDDDGSAQIIDLQRRLGRWRAISSLAMAAAASLVLVMLLAPGLRSGFGDGQPSAPGATETPEAPLLAASIPLGETALRLALTYVPGHRQLIVSASGLVADGRHDHELWLEDRAGGLHSLGVIAPGTEASHRVDPGLAGEFQPGARLLLTREPLGGKPADLAAGPVVAEGRLASV